MNPFIIYSIEVIIASVILGVCYMAFFKELTLFRFNRFYLLLSIVLPFVLPLLELPMQEGFTLPNVSVLLDEVVIGVDQVEAVESASPLSLLKWLYIGLTLVLVVRIVIGIISIISLFRKSKKTEFNKVTVYACTEKVNPFSVFKRIVVAKEALQETESMQRILLHEQTHIKQHHGIDCFIAEIACALFWFNPMLWWLKKELKSTHEYLADEKVLEENFDLADYFMLMLNSIVGQNVGIANNFNQSLNLKRMKMMKKKRTSGFRKVMSLAMLPVIMCGTILLTTQCKTSQKAVAVEPQESTSDQVFMVVEEMPEFTGGDDALMQYLRKNVKFPAEAQEKGIQGRVYVQFIVRKDGEITDVTILKGVATSLDAEAKRVIEAMPNWKPGKQRGQFVNVSYRLPINFSLRGKTDINQS